MATQHDSTLAFAVLQRLTDLHAAYVGLEVLSGIADTDSHHVAALLAVINADLERVIEEGGPLSRPGPGFLRLVP